VSQDLEPAAGNGETVAASWKTLAQRVLRNRFARDVSLLAGGTALGQALVVLASPVLTRIYDPAAFGVFSVFSSIISIPMGVASLKYELAIPLAKDDESAVNVLALAALLVPITTLFVYLLLLLCGDALVRATASPQLTAYFGVMAASLLGAGIYQAFTLWAIRRRVFRPVAKSRVTQSIGQVATQVVLGLFHATGGLMAGDAIGRITSASVLATSTFVGERQQLKAVSWRGMMRAARAHRRFPIFSTSSVLLNSSGLYVPPLLFAGFYGEQVAGWFALGQRVIGIPMVLIGTAIAQVYLGEAANRFRADLHSLKRLYFKTARTLFAVTVVPLALLGIVGPALFAVVFGAKWHEAGEYVRLLTVMSILQFVIVPLSQMLNVLGRQDWQFAWDAGRLILVVGLLVAVHHRHATARTAVLTYSLSMAFSYVALWVLNILAMSKSDTQLNEGRSP
jgi:O-antigen/teichoic acid export membrane protein